MLNLRVMIIGLFLLCTAIASTWANNDIFPASSDAAKAKIGWNEKGYFLVDGKPVFLTAGEIHYARVPRELWRDRLWRTKQMGFNCIQMYVFWNAHEPKEGVFDFSDNLDLDAFLSLCQEMGLYNIVRVGPYCCAEWEHGGIPAWLSVKPGMVVRDMHDEYLKYADRYLAKIYEIVGKHQIHKGGSVIMTQLENEHPKGWGTDNKHPYLAHLYQKAREAGLEIPLFMSGLHHGGDPSGESPYKPGASPWFSTEFWTGWIGKYGDMDAKMLNEKIRGTWKIIAFGGGGYDYYVVHGGTNFGYSGNDSYDATYDYSAPIGETGQFHNLYAPARRAACFAQCFSSLLTESADAPAFAKSASGDRVTTRKSPGGTIVFADNFQQPHDKNKAAQWIAPVASAYKTEGADQSQGAIITKLSVEGQGDFPKGGDLKIYPHDIRTLVFGLPWTKNCVFESIATNVLFRQNIAGTDTWVCHGKAGDYGEITLKRAGKPETIGFNYPKDAAVQEIPLDSGDGSKALLLVMNTNLADKTWWAKGKLVVGASFVREDGTVEMPMEGGKYTVYQASGKSEKSCSAAQMNAIPELKNWQWRDAARETSANYDDSKWTASKSPRPMETYDGYQNRYGWYRAKVKGGASPETVNLRVAGMGGYPSVFLNGEPAKLNALALKPGENTLALLMKSDPRPKWYNFMSACGTDAAKGIWGPVSMANKPFLTITEWKTLSTDNTSAKDLENFAKPDFNDQAWESVRETAEKKEVSLNKKETWMRGSFDLTETGKGVFAWLPARTVRADALFVNGKSIPLGKEQYAALDLTPCLKPGKNIVALHLINNAGKNKTPTVKLSMGLWLADDSIVWKFRPGLEGLEETAILGRVLNWKEFLGNPWSKEPVPADTKPRMYRATFEFHPRGKETIGLVTTGMKPGHAWVNGRNIGECPQKVPLYIPECWMNDGANELVIFDTQGMNPAGNLKLQRYEAFQLSEVK